MNNATDSTGSVSLTILSHWAEIIFLGGKIKLNTHALTIFITLKVDGKRLDCQSSRLVTREDYSIKT